MSDRDEMVDGEEVQAYATPQEPAVKVETSVKEEDGGDAESAAAGEGEEPKMKKQSGYLYYCGLHREAVTQALADKGLEKGEQNKQVMKTLGAQWSALDADAKKKMVEDAPMVVVKPKKPKKPKAASASGGTGVDAKALRDLKALRDEGVLSEGEFIAKKAQVLGLTCKEVAEGVAAGEAASGMPPPPPGAKPAKKSKKSDKPPRMELPTSALDPFMKELCECQQENPKRQGSKSAEMYDNYKGAQTFEEMMGLGAKKADIANDVAKGFCTLQNEEQQERIMGMRREAKPSVKRVKSEVSEGAPEGDAEEKPEKKAKKESTGGTKKIDPKYVAIRGRYFVRRVANDPEDGLEDGYEGPTQYSNSTGALVLSVPPTGAIRMRGITDPAGGKLFAPTMTPTNQTAKPNSAGEFKFKLEHAALDGLEMATGTVKLKLTEFKDSRDQPILVGKYEFHAKRPDEDLDSLWEEQIRCTRAPPETPDWPEHLFPDHPTTQDDLEGTMEE